jgi:tetratricopeptide (TPR) repeat protein
MKPTSYSYNHFEKRRHAIIPKIILAVCIIGFVTFFSFFIYNFISQKNTKSIKTLYAQWAAYDYSAVYKTSAQILREKPLNNTAHTLRGYACFYLAVSQTDTTKARNYLDESINNIRIAIYNAKKSLKPQLYYMLGKAYFYKDTTSSYHYYADLAVTYLQKSKDTGYVADDIPEYLGLSYAALGMTMKSIASFTEALLVRESDSLLMSIAEQYYKADQLSAAKQYLYRIITSSTDEELVLKSHLLLGQIYIAEKDYISAGKEFETILEKNKNSADAYYELGVIYEKQGDLIKARSEWRTALRIQPNHADALQKMTDYK